MREFDADKFEDWCREVLPELATFQAACVFGNRRKAGTTVGKQGPSVWIYPHDDAAKDAAKGAHVDALR